MLYRYDPSLVSIPMDEMSRFLSCVSDLFKQECRTAKLHGDMNLSRLTVYAQSIEESKFSRILKNLNKSKSNY